MIDIEKLKAYINSPWLHLGEGQLDPHGLPHDEAEQIEEALEDPISEESQTARKLSACYMEMKDPAGSFACMNCEYFMSSGVCAQEAVRADVSAEYGTCNYYCPSDKSTIVFPPQKDASILASEETPPDEEFEEEIED